MTTNSVSERSLPRRAILLGEREPASFLAGSTGQKFYRISSVVVKRWSSVKDGGPGGTWIRIDGDGGEAQQGNK